MNKPFNFQKSPLVLATALCALSFNALAETYTVQVELNSSIGETPLVATQTQTMSYPVLEVNEITQEGANCIASSRANEEGFNGQAATNANSLCPGSIGQSSSIVFSGVPNAIISIGWSIASQEANGIRFANTDGQAGSGTLTRTLSSVEGKTVLEKWSSVTLIDKSQVTDAVMEFTYDISAAYQ